LSLSHLIKQVLILKF